MMNNSYKKDILKNIIGSKGVTLGAPSANQVVRFQYATSIATAAANETAGALTFAHDENGYGAIYANGTLVSSKIQDITTAVTGANGGKTVTVTYVVPTTGDITSSTFDVIDEAALESYLTNSNTIRVVSSNGNPDKLEVNIDSSTILVDTTNKFLKTGLEIHYEPSHAAGSEGYPEGQNAQIQLRDAHNTVLSYIDVANIAGNGGLESTSYDPITNILTLTFNTASGGTEDVEIDLSKLIDVTDILLDTDNDADDYLTLNSTTDSSVAVFGVTQKTKDAIAAAENSLQTLTTDSYLTPTKTSNTSNEVIWNVSANVADFTITNGTVNGNSDTSISGTANKLVKSDDAATKIQTFVNARIAEEIAKLDSTAATADLSTTTGEEVYVKITGELVDGKFKSTNGLTVSTQIATTKDTAYVKAVGDTPLTNPSLNITTNGLATDKDITNIISYVNDKVQQLKDETNASVDSLDASVVLNDSKSYINTGFEQNEGQIENEWISNTYGAYGSVTRDSANVTTFANATHGIATAEDTQTFIQTIVQGLDLTTSAANSSANDASNFIKTTISETDGIVKNESVAVTYAAITATPGDVTVNTNGIVKGDVLESAIEGALTWTILPNNP